MSLDTLKLHQHEVLERSYPIRWVKKMEAESSSSAKVMSSTESEALEPDSSTSFAIILKQINAFLMHSRDWHHIDCRSSRRKSCISIEQDHQQIKYIIERFKKKPKKHTRCALTKESERRGKKKKLPDQLQLLPSQEKQSEKVPFKTLRTITPLPVKETSFSPFRNN